MFVRPLSHFVPYRLVPLEIHVLKRSLPVPPEANMHTYVSCDRPRPRTPWPIRVPIDVAWPKYENRPRSKLCKNVHKDGQPDIYTKSGLDQDGDCFFSQRSSLAAHVSHEKTTTESMQVECVDIKNWLEQNIPHSALTVAKIDIEKSEFEIIPYLLKYPDTFRRIDELYLECHHIETWGHRPYRLKDCLKMFEDIRKIGIVVHEWF